MTDVIQERIQLLEQRLANDPQSPMFARLASMYLKAGRASDALRLCDDGLALYPFYSTAHLVKGKALVELGMMAEAKHEYEVVHELMPTNVTLARLVSSIETESSLDLGTAPPQEIVPQPDAGAAAAPVEDSVVEEPQPGVIEEVLQPEPENTEEISTPVETLSEPELLAEHSESILAVETGLIEEDSFGFQAPPAVEAELPPPSGYETPGFGADETPQPETTETALTVTPEEPQAPPIAGEEQQALADNYGFGIVATAPPLEPIAQESRVVPEVTEPSPSNAPEDSFGVPIDAAQIEPAAEPMHGLESPVAEAPSAIEPSPVPELPLPDAPPVVEARTAPEPPAAEIVAAETSPTNTDQTPDWFEAFAQLQQPTTETPEPPPAAAVEEENPFAMFGAEQTPAAAEGEPYEDYAARIRMELFGTEDTVTLDEYLGTSKTEPPTATNQIGELAEKLKSSPRITPPVINFSEKSPRPSTEGETSSGSGFVTPTLAEIYVKQGWFDDAIKAYRALVVNKPAEKEKFELRIAEIEEMKKKQ